MSKGGPPCQTLGVRIQVVTSDNFSFSPSLFILFSVKKPFAERWGLSFRFSCERTVWTLKSFIYIDGFRTHNVT